MWQLAPVYPISYKMSKILVNMDCQFIDMQTFYVDSSSASSSPSTPNNLVLESIRLDVPLCILHKAKDGYPCVRHKNSESRGVPRAINANCIRFLVYPRMIHDGISFFPLRDRRLSLTYMYTCKIRSVAYHALIQFSTRLLARTYRIVLILTVRDLYVTYF